MTCVFSELVQSGEFYGPKQKIKGPPIMCGAPEVILRQRGPDAWDLFHGEETKRMVVELSDKAINGHLPI